MTADELLAGAVDIVRNLIRHAELLTQTTQVAGSEDGSFALADPIAIDFIQI